VTAEFLARVRLIITEATSLTENQDFTDFVKTLGRLNAHMILSDIEVTYVFTKFLDYREYTEDLV
jgi:hypothetical protein